MSLPDRVRRIQGICFSNGAQFDFTSVEPPGNPSGFQGFSGGDGGGGLYLGSGLGIEVVQCDFIVNSGVGLYTGGVQTFQPSIRDCNFTGPGYNPGRSVYNQSYGIFSNGRLIQSGGRMNALGICISHGGSPGGAGMNVEDINTEVSGIAMIIGQNPLSFWWNDQTVEISPRLVPPWSGGGGGQVKLSNMVME